VKPRFPVVKHLRIPVDEVLHAAMEHLESRANGPFRHAGVRERARIWTLLFEEAVYAVEEAEARYGWQPRQPRLVVAVERQPHGLCPMIPRRCEKVSEFEAVARVLDPS